MPKITQQEDLEAKAVIENFMRRTKPKKYAKPEDAAFRAKGQGRGRVKPKKYVGEEASTEEPKAKAKPKPKPRKRKPARKGNPALAFLRAIQELGD